METITKEQECTLLLYSIYTILYINDTACFSIQQIGPKVKEKDKESQKIYGALIKRGNGYLRNVSNLLSVNLDEFCDYCAIMDDIVDDHYYNFKDSVKKAYKEAGIDDYEYCSEVEIVRSIVELSVETNKKIIEDVSKHVKEAKHLDGYLMTDLMRVANNFADWSYRKVPKDIKVDLKEGSDVINKLQELSKFLIDYSSFEKAYNGSAKKVLTKED